MPAKKKDPVEDKGGGKVAEQPEAAPEPQGIDARMAALLKDHQRMGARPK